MDIVISAGVVNIASKIAEYFGLIESVSTNVRRLLHQAFNSAKDNLEYARISKGNNQIDYVKRAKDCFVDAIAVEENENKILALVGLSMCQYFLHDIDGAQRSMYRIREVNLSSAEINKFMAMDAVIAGTTRLFPVNYFVFKVVSKMMAKHDFDDISLLHKRESELEDMKKKAIQINNKLIEQR